MKRVIHNRSRLNQQILFEGLEYGKLSYTDLDFIQERKGKLLICGDVKVRGIELPLGQRLLIQRLCDKWSIDGSPAYGVVSEHDVSPNQDVILSQTNIREVYHNGKWEHVVGKTFLDLNKAINKKYKLL